MALIELNDCCRPFCRFGGVVETPEGITYEDMPRLHREWQQGDSADEFADWLVRNHGCTEIPCGYALLEMDKEDECDRAAKREDAATESLMRQITDALNNHNNESEV